jgi:large subunit ribosomal protein L4
MADKKITTQLYDQTGKEVKKIDLNPAVFGIEIKESVVHQVSVAQANNSRVAIAHTKTKGEVRGGGKKPWRQKGTGRARHGSSRSPLWVGGGVTFGPRSDRNFSEKVNKKMKTKALFMCLSNKVNSDWLILLDKLELAEGKTKEISEIIKQFKTVLKLDKKSKKVKAEKEVKEAKKSDKFDIKNYKLSLLIVLPKSDKKVFNAGRNLTGVKVITANSLNVNDLLKYKNVIIAEEAIQEIEKIFLKK